MSKALGLVETRGLVAAIGAADAMLKAADVTFAGKEKVEPAMVTIKVTGDVASVNAAVEAGAAAAQRIGQLISAHVIPKPDDQLVKMFPEIFADKISRKKSENESNPEEKLEDLKKAIRKEVHSPEPEATPLSENISEKITRIKKEVEKSGVTDIPDTAPVKETKAKPAETEPEKKNDEESSLFESENDTISRLRKEALGIKEGKKKHEPAKTHSPEPPAIVEPSLLTDDYLLSLNVHLLRKLARNTKNFPIHGREISKANRQELLDLFSKLR